MFPVIATFGKINIYTHGILIVLGVLSGGFLLHLLAKKKQYQTYFILDLCLFSLLGGLVGARLMYFWLYFNQFSYWYEIFYIWQGGLVSFGGFLGAFLVAFFFLKNKKQSVWEWFDLAIAPFFIGWALGRVGCFLTGDIIGLASSSKIAINGELPVSIFEVVLAMVVAIVGFILSKRAIWPKGLIFSFSLGLYGLGRFFIDLFRVDNYYGLLKYSQIGDVLLIVLAIMFIFLIVKKGIRV